MEQGKPSQQYEEQAETALNTLTHYVQPQQSDLQVVGAGLKAIALALLAIACAIRER